MKKIVFITIIILLISVLIKYFISPYDISYKIGDFKVKENYKDNKIEIEISDDNYFVINIFKKRNIFKKIVTNIEKIKHGEYVCYNVKIKQEEDELICFRNKDSISYYLIDEPEMIKYFNSLNLPLYKDNIETEDFKFYNNIDTNVYIALWNYNGFNIINNGEITDLKIFDKTRYDNSLCYQYDEYLIFPNYNVEHEFNEFKRLNLKNGNIEDIKTKYNIDYDSYISGKFKNNIYLFDNKYYKLYELNVQKKKIVEIGNEDIGFIKIDNNRKVKSSKKEYKDRITYFDETSNYIIENDGIFRVYNNKYKVKIFNSDEVHMVKEIKNDLYFIYKDNLYLYNNNEGIKKIFHYFELNFNSTNMIYIYIDN